MPERIARKRLKKKMLDRWENEGGKVADDPSGVEVNRPTNEGSDKQRSASRKSTSAPSTKKRKSTVK